MRIQHNIMAMNTHRQLGINNLNQAKSTEKLSSGYRINRAADDAAGLYISEKMRAQIRGLTQASANAQDGISLIQAAEGALQETHSILQRMRELAVKAANDVNETEDRGAINAEMQQLSSEIDRIAYATEFNKKTLLNGSLSAGAKYGKATAPIGNVSVGSNVANGTYSISITAAATRQIVTNGTVISMNAGDLVTYDTNITINDILNSSTDDGAHLSVQLRAGMNAAEVSNAIVAAVNLRQDSLYTAELTAAGEITFTAKDVGLLYLFDGTAVTDQVSFDLTNVQTGATGANTMAGVAAPSTAISSVDAKIEWINSAGTTAAITFDATTGMWSAGAGSSSVQFRWQGELQPTSIGDYKMTVSIGSELTLQVGANSGYIQTIGISVDNLSATGLGIANLKVNNHRNSQTSIDAIESALAKVSEQRSALGAVQNRLEHTVANLDTIAENLQSAEAAIRDVDMAKEMMAFTKNNILTQAATAMLAQANQNPQTVLQLLR